jgi:glycosyltransferase involved in cell wall biosynthesis
MKKISIVVPVYFNALSLPHLFSRLKDVANQVKVYQFEFVFVDDGSKDTSYKLLAEFAEQDSRAIVVKLSRNFGSFRAILAGLEYATGDCAAIISADLQDPPELVIQMIEKWEQGDKVIMAVREKREDSFLVRFFAKIYYLLMRRFALPDMPTGGFDFVLIDRKIIEILKTSKEKNTSLMGLILWCGFKRSILYYTRKKREHGKSMWTLSKKLKYFVDSFVAFSYAPIRFFQLIGIGLALLGFLYAIFIIIRRILYGFPIPGISALIVITLVIGAVQLLMIGVIGEYLWRNVDEVKNRPVFIVESVLTKGCNQHKEAGF